MGERVLGLPKEPKVEAGQVALARPVGGDRTERDRSRYPRSFMAPPRPSATIDDPAPPPAPATQPKAPAPPPDAGPSARSSASASSSCCAILAGIVAVGYGYYRFNQINKEKLSLTKVGANEPQNYLIVGSDSRDGSTRATRTTRRSSRRADGTGRSAPTRS